MFAAFLESSVSGEIEFPLELARVVTTVAAPLEDWEDVFVEADLFIFSACGGDQDYRQERDYNSGTHVQDWSISLRRRSRRGRAGGGCICGENRWWWWLLLHQFGSAHNESNRRRPEPIIAIFVHASSQN